MKAPIVISIPHGGLRVPDELEAGWGLSRADAFHDGDPLVASIYDFADRARHQIAMEYFRAAVDLNRAPGDIAPVNPDGLIKSHTCYNVPVYRQGGQPDAVLEQCLIERYYAPYHRQLQQWLADDSVKLGVDCHSMAAVAPPISSDAGAVRPLFCLGNLGGADGAAARGGQTTAPAELLHFMARQFEELFGDEAVDVDPPAVAALNVPFNGGYITRQSLSGKVPFLQIEMSRALYLAKPWFDEVTLEVDPARIADLNARIWTVLERTIAQL